MSIGEIIIITVFATIVAICAIFAIILFVYNICEWVAKVNHLIDEHNHEKGEDNEKNENQI